MRRERRALLLFVILAGSTLVVAMEGAVSWSDGVAGMSGAIPLHLRKCTPGLNSHALTGLASNVEYAFQVVGKYASGSPAEDISQVLRFRTASGSGGKVAKDDQLTTLPAAILTEHKVTLLGGYSAGTVSGDEMESFRFIYVSGDHSSLVDLRRAPGAVDTGARTPMSTVVSATVAGLVQGELYTYQVVAERTRGARWEIVGKPVTFRPGVNVDDNVEASPAVPGDNPGSAWTLQSLTASTYGKQRKFASLEFYYNLAARVPASASDIRDTPNVIKVVKNDPTGGFKYCKVQVSGCGGCHGQWEDMLVQRHTEQPVIDRVSAELWINGRADAWEYSPGQTYLIDIYVKSNRAPGEYNRAGFNLNVSGGRFVLFDGEDMVRITAGNFSHSGSKNPDYRVCHPQTGECRPYGQTTDDESQYAGELTNTGKGANPPKTPQGYHWRAKWVAPPRGYPNGVDFTLAFMVPTGEGFDNGTYVQGNTSLGYSDQNFWDWWSFIIPRRIVCERGVDRKICEERVLAFTRPPAPPPNTAGPTDDGNGIGPNLTPLPAGHLAAAVLAAVALGLAHRRGRHRGDAGR